MGSGKQVHPSIRRDGKPNWPSPSNRSALTPRKPPGDSTSVDPSPEKWNEADGPGPSPTSTPTMSARQGISLACGASGKALGLSYRPIYWDGGGIRGNSSNASADFGTDARYRITPNLSATLSYNTDFAEAEVDQRQLNFTRFPSFSPSVGPSSWRTVVCLNMED